MYRVGAILFTILFLVGCTKNAAKSKPGESESKKSVAKSELTPEQAESAAEDELMELEMGFNKAQQMLAEKLGTLPPEEQNQVYLDESQDKQFASKYLELAKKYPDTSSEFTAIRLALAHGNEETINDAIGILGKKFINDERMGEMLESFNMVASIPRQEHEDFLKTVTKNSTNRNVKGGALFALTELYKNVNRLKGIFGTKELDDETKEMLSYVLKDRGDSFASEQEKMYESLVKEFSDVSFGNKKIGELAEGELFVSKYLSLGKIAPDIEGVDLDGKEFKLSDYRGKVVMLDFWGDW